MGAVGRVDGDVCGFDGDVAAIFAALEAAVCAELEAEGGQADFLAGKDFYFGGDAGAIDEGAVEGI